MDSAERAALIDELRATGEKFCAEASGLSAAQAKFKPAPESWSIEGCVEHVAMVEKGFFKRLAQDFTVVSIDTAGTDAARPEPEFRKKLVDRNNRMKAPELIQPTGRYGSLADALDRFRVYREETVAYLSACQDDLRARRVAHPLYGTLTCREAFLFMIDHPLRHLEQIREIKASPNYPK